MTLRIDLQNASLLDCLYKFFDKCLEFLQWHLRRCFECFAPKSLQLNPLHARTLQSTPPPHLFRIQKYIVLEQSKGKGRNRANLWLTGFVFRELIYFSKRKIWQFSIAIN